VRGAGVTAVIATHDWRPERLPGVRVLSHRIERAEGWTRALFWD
jgi:putative ABC transport system ATP-binding protein